MDFVRLCVVEIFEFVSKLSFQVLTVTHKETFYKELYIDLTDQCQYYFLLKYVVSYKYFSLGALTPNRDINRIS